MEEHNKSEDHKGHHANKKESSKLNAENMLLAAAVLAGIILVINITLGFGLKGEFDKSIAEAKEKARPARIELSVIKNSRCSDCYDISAAVDEIKGANVNITSEKIIEYGSKEAKDAVDKYSIEKLPALIITGETEKIGIQGLQKKEDALLLESIGLPYTNATSGKINGLVALYRLKDFACSQCNNLTELTNQIKASGVRISVERDIDINSAEGKGLAKKSNIGFVPAMILSKDAGLYPIIAQAWPQIGTRESDGSYVLRTVYPPFANLTTGEVMGLIDAVYLTDKSCMDCYDVGIHKQIMTGQGGFGMSFISERAVDIGDPEGKELVSKYNITNAPTIILSKGASDYPAASALPQFYSVEKDGSYVFRKLSLMGAYKDLATGKIVENIQNDEIPN